VASLQGASFFKDIKTNTKMETLATLQMHLKLHAGLGARLGKRLEGRIDLSLRANHTLACVAESQSASLSLQRHE
jgi:hypothetical protein